MPPGQRQPYTTWVSHMDRALKRVWFAGEEQFRSQSLQAGWLPRERERGLCRKLEASFLLSECEEERAEQGAGQTASAGARAVSRGRAC